VARGTVDLVVARAGGALGDDLLLEGATELLPDASDGLLDLVEGAVGGGAVGEFLEARPESPAGTVENG
jgi:hypothetical protein